MNSTLACLRGMVRAIDRRWEPLLVALYLASRLPALFLHELHNDESIFMRYSQLMLENWGENRYLTIDGRLFGQYLAPLQFWIGAVALRMLHNPFLLRLVALFFGLLGFLCWTWLARAVAGRRAALATAFLLLCAPYYELFDVLFMGEVFVYGLGGLYLCCLYAFFDRCWGGRFETRWIGGAIVAGGLALLSKESGALFLAAGLPLAGLPLAVRGGRVRDHLGRLLVSVGLAVGVALAATLLAHSGIPAQFHAVKANNTRLLGEAFTLQEAFGLPVADWVRNGRFFLSTLGKGGNILALLLPAAWWGWLAATGRGGGCRAVAGWLLAMWLVTVLPLVLLLKVTYVRHHGLALCLLYLLAGCVLAWLWDRGGPARAVTALGLAAAALGALVSFYLPLARERYTAIAAAETTASWASGAGIFSMLDTVAKLPPGFLLLDPVWGFPRMPVEVFADRYLQLRLLQITPPLLETMGLWEEGQETVEAAAMIGEASRQGLKIYVLFETNPDRPRPWVSVLLKDPRWCRDRVVLEKRWRGKDVGPSRRVLCTAGF